MLSWLSPAGSLPPLPVKAPCSAQSPIDYCNPLSVPECPLYSYPVGCSKAQSILVLPKRIINQRGFRSKMLSSTPCWAARHHVVRLWPEDRRRRRRQRSWSRWPQVPRWEGHGNLMGSFVVIFHGGFHGEFLGCDGDLWGCLI